MRDQMYEPSKCRVCHTEIPGRHPSVPPLTVCANCLGAGAPFEPPAPTAPALPEGIMSEGEIAAYEAKGDARHAGMSYAQQVEANERYCESASYHLRKGQGG